MVLLQMYHYVRHTVSNIVLARATLSAGDPSHGRYRRLLDDLEEEEAGHEEMALADLAALGYQAEACRRTLPLPTTANVAAEARLSISTLGPYAYLGSLMASEEGAALTSSRMNVLCRAHEQLCVIRFFEVHGLQTGHGAKASACGTTYLSTQYRPILHGFISTSRNLMLLGQELQDASAYPIDYQLPPRARVG